jgi:CBS domain-containing protein
MHRHEANELILELRRRNPFDRMNEDHIRWLVKHMDLVKFPQDTIIISPNIPCDSLYFIHQGVIVIEAMGGVTEGKRILAELVDGESFPLEALEEHRSVLSYWRAKSDTLCYRVSSDVFEKLKSKSTVFAEFCKYRAASFFEQSRRAYRLHFSHQSEEQQLLNISLSLIMRPNPPTARPKQAIKEVLTLMQVLGEEVIVVANEDGRPQGLFTLRDLLHNVVIPGVNLENSIDEVINVTFKTLPPTALGYEAALAMIEDGSSHIVVIEDQRLQGIVSEKELFNLQRVSLTQISSEIRSANSLELLKRSFRDILLVTEAMLIQGVRADQITQIISSLNDQIFARTLELEMGEEDFAGADVCWMALGSEGRLEQTFATDQDNALIFRAPKGMTDEAIRARLLPVAQRVNRALDDLGFPLCKGNIMAGNPACCLSFNEWQKKFEEWIEKPSAEALLNASIFFDFRHLYGEVKLSDRLRSWLAAKVTGNTRFFHLLTENTLNRTPPIGFFRDFILEDHEEHPKTIDIKLNGVTLFVDAARIYALASGVTRSNTKQRLMAAGDVRKWPPSETTACAEAFSFLQSLRVRHQFELQRNGSNPHNRLNPYELNNLDRKALLESLRQAGKLQKRLSKDFLIREI